MDLRSAKPSESSYFGILDENLFMAFTRAKLQGEAKRFAELGYDTVLISQYYWQGAFV